MKRVIIGGIGLCIGFLVHAEPNAKAGEPIATTVCAACHGPKGISTNAEWPNLAGQGEKYIIKQLNDLKSGARVNAVMSPQASQLSDSDVANLSAYFAAQPPAPAATKGVSDDPDALLTVGRDLYRGGDQANGIPACAACHGPTGGGIEPAAFPALSGQHANYTRAQLVKFQQAALGDDQASDAKITEDQQRHNDPNQMMRDIARKLTPKQIEAVALYIQGLH